MKFTDSCFVLFMGSLIYSLHHLSTFGPNSEKSTRRLLAEAAGMEPDMLPAEFHYAGNNAGRWMWAGGESSTHDVVAVVSTAGPGLTQKLLRHGYTVWKAVKSKAAPNTRQWNLDRRIERQYGIHVTSIVRYCTDPFGPRARTVVFISENRKDLITRIEDAVRHSKTTGTVAPLRGSFSVGPGHPRHGFIVDQLRQAFPQAVTNESAALTGYNNLEFALPLHVLQSHPAKYYSRVYSLPFRGGKGFFETVIPNMFMTAASKQFPSQLAVKVKGIVKSNAMGTWTYDPEGSNLDTIVVVGGQNVDPTEVLVRAGYVVWMRNDDCRGLLKKATKATRDSIYAACREMWGYLGYLSDSDPAKPVGKQVAFVHGHLQSWHQPGDLGKIISDAVSCSNKVDGYVPLTKVRTANINRKWEESGMAEKWIAHWNKQYGDIYTVKGKRLESFCCASAVVPQSVIEKRPVSEYARFADPSTFVLQSGFFWEYMFPMVFGQPEVVDTSKTLASCPYTYSNSFGPYIPGVGLR
eukprot:TRINITY_DN2318_c0_g1_i3.p1 TRINITY_DN2318_c0_g1~~TRINITY_DN2318_c0_g1_i3.p1  ORF type:complete len:539 (+),score=122.22 TRINITY_DN2318_c0_g1_i3:53-1618(+)